MNSSRSSRALTPALDGPQLGDLHDPLGGQVLLGQHTDRLRALLGKALDVLDEHVKDKYGCEELIMQVIYGGMPRDAAEKSIQLFGREVVPAVHEMGVAAMVG